MEILAERMKRLRLDNKMKQTDVAKILGVAISTYCSYEYGQREPNAGIVAALAQLYRVPADHLLGLDGAVLGKPRDEAAAFAMLSSLSGREHQVYTGVTVALGDRVVTQHEQTAVAFRELQPDEILGYIATGEPMDKAGAYGIQGLGALLVSGIRGDYHNVMGLPVFRLGRVLAGFGVDLLRPAGR